MVAVVVVCRFVHHDAQPAVCHPCKFRLDLFGVILQMAHAFAAIVTLSRRTANFAWPPCFTLVI